MFKKSFFVFVLVIFQVSVLFANIYYIDNEATGTKNGTSWNNAWEKFSDINWNSIQAGDIIYISGGTVSKTYYENIIVPEGKSGLAGNPITITKGVDSGHDGTVILDGINISNLPAIWIEGSSYITVSELDLRRWLCSPLNRGTFGVFDSDHIIIENNIILGWSQGLKIQGSNNCIYRNNYYTTSETVDNQTDGIYAAENYDNIYEGNYVNISNSDDDHNDCFQGQTEGACIIRNNYFTHSGGSALKPVDSQGIFDKYANGLHQYINNFIYLPNKSTSSQQMNDGVLDQQNPTSSFPGNGEPASVILLNNTIVGASTHTLGIEAEDILAKNNLVILLDDIALVKFENVIDKSQIDFNIYYKNSTTGNEVINGYSNFTEWQSDGGDLHGKNVNPLVGANFETLPGTPPVDTGTDLTNFGVLNDINGIPRPQDAAYDIGAFEVDNSVSESESNNNLPEDFILEQNYPNPFNPSTKISFTIPHDSHVNLSVYNLLGEKLTTLTDTDFAEGRHSIDFFAVGLSAGVYFYRLTVKNFSITKKLSLAK